jgi:proteasome lid subunit RPN8/RPN11
MDWWTEAHKEQVARQLAPLKAQDLQQERLFALDPYSDEWVMVAAGHEVVAECTGLKAAGWLHTHPTPSYEPLVPSALDMQVMGSSDLPHGIANFSDPNQPFNPVWWHSSIKPSTLVGRQYRWGDYGSDGKGDCYAAIKDWFLLQRGIELPSIPRDFYDKEGLYYSLGHATHASIVPLQGLQVGDIPVLRFGKQGEHAGVYTGEGCWLHHPIRGVCRTETFSRYMPHVKYVLRVHH